MDFLHVTYEVGGESSPSDAFQRHSGQEWGYVLSGTLAVRIGFDEFLLQPGDAISFDSATPHRLFNADNVPATAVWFVLGRRSADVGEALRARSTPDPINSVQQGYSATRHSGRLVTAVELRRSRSDPTERRRSEEARLANHVGRVDWSFTAAPMPASERSSGLARQVLVGPAQGAVHTELAAGAFAEGGWLRRHIHSFEEGLYVLSGELVLDIGGDVHRLVGGDYGLIPIGTWHALANGGDSEVRWLSVNTPQRLAADAGRRDTFFTKDPFDAMELVGRAMRPRFGDPAVRYVGHYEGTPPQAEALRVNDPARGRKPAGMDTALLAYSGISVKMMIDRASGPTC